MPSYDADGETHSTTSPGYEQEDHHDYMHVDERNNEDSDRCAESDEAPDVPQRIMPGPNTEVRGTHNIAQAQFLGDIVCIEHRSHKRKRTDSNCGDVPREPK